MKYINAMLDHHNANDKELKSFTKRHAERLEKFLKKWEKCSKEKWYQKEIENLNKVKAYI